MCFIVPSLDMSHYCFSPSALVMCLLGRLKNPLLQNISLHRHLYAISKSPLHLQRRKGRSCRFKAASKTLARPSSFLGEHSPVQQPSQQLLHNAASSHAVGGIAPLADPAEWRGGADAGARLPRRRLISPPLCGRAFPQSCPTSGQRRSSACRSPGALRRIR